jgi:hypothetical protein
MKKLTIVGILIVVLLNTALAFAEDGTRTPTPTRSNAQMLQLNLALTIGDGGSAEGPGPGGGDVSEDDLNAACPHGWIVTYDEDSNGDPVPGSQQYSCLDADD